MSDNVACREKEWYEYYPYHKIWANEHFTLIPIFKKRNGDQYNTNSYYFRWLCFNFWTMDHFSFGFDIDIEFNRIGFGFVLPYLRIWIGPSHIYTNWSRKIDNFLRRKPPVEKK